VREGPGRLIEQRITRERVGNGEMKMDRNDKVALDKISHRNRELPEQVWRVLRQQPVIRALDLGHISVTVRRGRVFLRGHVRSKRLVEETVAGVPGLRGVHSTLVADRELAASVALALSQDPGARPYPLRVDVSHGWLRLLGEVPSWKAQEAVEAVVARQPLVRGVVQLPAVAGEPSDGRRRAIQPPVGAEVIDAHGPPYGRVTQIIIDPYSRLVTHAVVDIPSEANGPMGARTSNLVVVPASEIKQVAPKAVYLRRDSASVATYPFFSSAHFPAPPPVWCPPFPYRNRTVRWSRMPKMPAAVNAIRPRTAVEYAMVAEILTSPR
jgi:osmotically-inducible protein OsmY/sporulation protein YlmC with PRC-barrel domain